MTRLQKTLVAIIVTAALVICGGLVWMLMVTLPAANDAHHSLALLDRQRQTTKYLADEAEWVRCKDQRFIRLTLDGLNHNPAAVRVDVFLIAHLEAHAVCGHYPTRPKFSR